MQSIYSRQSKYSHYIKLILFMFSLGYLAFVLISRAMFPEFYHHAIQEDALFEFFQPLFYGSASILSGFNCYLFFKQNQKFYGYCSLLFSSLLVFVSLEEVSWGQRIFNLDVPTFFAANNFQKEISIHNLNQVHYMNHYVFIAAGLLFSFACLLVSLPIRSKQIRLFLSPLYRWIPGIYSIFYFLPLALIYLTLEFFRSDVGKSLQWRDQEPAELLFSMGILLVTCTVFARFSKESP